MVSSLPVSSSSANEKKPKSKERDQLEKTYKTSQSEIMPEKTVASESSKQKFWWSEWNEWFKPVIVVPTMVIVPTGLIAGLVGGAFYWLKTDIDNLGRNYEEYAAEIRKYNKDTTSEIKEMAVIL